jgi:hypothetical protein
MNDIITALVVRMATENRDGCVRTAVGMVLHMTSAQVVLGPILMVPRPRAGPATCRKLVPSRLRRR